MEKVRLRHRKEYERVISRPIMEMRCAGRKFIELSQDLV
jgi:hypothetical protein